MLISRKTYLKHVHILTGARLTRAEQWDFAQTPPDGYLDNALIRHRGTARLARAEEAHGWLNEHLKPSPKAEIQAAILWNAHPPLLLSGNAHLLRLDAAWQKHLKHGLGEEERLPIMRLGKALYGPGLGKSERLGVETLARLTGLPLDVTECASFRFATHLAVRPNAQSAFRQTYFDMVAAQAGVPGLEPRLQLLCHLCEEISKGAMLHEAARALPPPRKGLLHFNKEDLLYIGKVAGGIVTFGAGITAVGHVPQAVQWTARKGVGYVHEIRVQERQNLKSAHSSEPEAPPADSVRFPLSKASFQEKIKVTKPGALHTGSGI